MARDYSGEKDHTRYMVSEDTAYDRPVWRRSYDPFTWTGTANTFFHE